MAFTHLHVHTEYSLLDGLSRIHELPGYVKEIGMDSVAITDHGVMFGAVDFYKECKKQGIKPIIGCEVYTAARTRFDRDPELDRHQGHLILLAENETGYRNLIKIVSIGYSEGFYFKPRIDKDVLREHSEGIICLSACIAGEVQYRLLHNDYDGARREALELAEIFGDDNFFLEIQDHGLQADKPVIAGLKRLSVDLGIPLVATNDAHYIRKEDAYTQDVLMALQMGTTIDDDTRMRFETDEFYIKTEAEMRELFSDIPEACDMTQVIADRCSFDFTFGEYHLPDFVPPEGYNNNEYLRKLCYDGLARRYGAEALNEDSSYRQRLEMELNVIETMGYVEYFLIVWDFINYAKKNGIPVGPGRGSAAGSIVAYSLAITEIDPIRYSLIFERFLNPERVSMPDIDIDFCIDRRQEVIEYVNRKYGSERVSQICTFGTLKAKAAVRDIARTLNASYAEGDSIAKAIPADLGMTITKALDVNPKLKERYDNEPLVKNILDVSMAVEGAPRHVSTHAAGVVISKLPLDEYVPLYYSDKGAATQFNMTTIEELGLLKFDFLGLRNLTVLNNALEMIKKNHGVTIDFATMGYDDPAVYEMIADGNTKGIFQLESGGMTDFMKRLRPTCFEDIVAGISLYRPGPMDSIPKYIDNKKHPDNIVYVDPHLEPILSVTYGCLVYQEQVMQIVRDLGGYSYGRSDLVRRAMSKKKMSVMLEEKEYFIHGKKAEDGTVEIKGCVANGIPEAAAQEIFDDMVSFAQYAFNKSHAAAYAVVAYETAYLKCHYPVEFMAALMSSVMGQARQIAGYIRNCNAMGIEVLPPSVLYSGDDFTAQDGTIRFGLLGIKNVGAGIVNAIIEARERDGKPSNIFDFINGIDPKELNRKAIESLIKAGALDDLDPNRAAHMAVYEEVVAKAQHNAKRNNKAQISFFQLDEGLMDEVQNEAKLPQVVNFSNDMLLSMEKEMIGVYISGHPLDEYKELIDKYVTATSTDIMGEPIDEDLSDYEIGRNSKFRDGDRVVMAGMFSSIKLMTTKKNQQMARFEFEDFGGVIGGIIFPAVFEKFRYTIRPDAILAISGRVSDKEDSEPEIMIDTVAEIEDIANLAASSRRGQAGRSYGNQGGQYSKQYNRNSSGGMPEDRMSQGGTHNPRPNGPGSLLKLRVTKEVQEQHGSNNEMLETITDVLFRYPGQVDVMVFMPDGSKLRTSKDYRVYIDDRLMKELTELLGSENIKC